MVKYREILRLRAMGVSQRNVAISCGCSPTTVLTVEHKAREAKLIWPLSEEFSDGVIKKRLYPPTKPKSTKYPIDHERFSTELSRRNVTLTLCWNEYCEQAVAHGAEPYQYSAFCLRQRKWQKEHSVVMHIGCKRAEKIEVDWAGDPARWINPDTGEEKRAWVFVAVLPYSQYIFAKAYPDMKEESWINAHIDAFTFFGGVTPILVPDNCKTGVLKNTLNELVLNESYRLMAEYYGCAVVPARPRKPKDKGSVESSVGLIERQAIAALRDKVFLSLDELNEAITKKVEQINSRSFQKREGSRQSVYFGQEKDALIPLPAHPYQIVLHKSATVQFNYHVAFEGMFYSVPFIHLRKVVDIAATSRTIEIFFQGERIAIHPRLYGHIGQYSTNIEHMPDTHRDYAEWNGDRFRNWAKETGSACACVVDALLRSKTVEQQAYRSCRALLELGKRHGADILERACAKALEYSKAPTYKTVKTIASKLVNEIPQIPNEHAYLRGNNYFDTNTCKETNND